MSPGGKRVWFWRLPRQKGERNAQLTVYTCTSALIEFEGEHHSEELRECYWALRVRSSDTATWPMHRRKVASYSLPCKVGQWNTARMRPESSHSSISIEPESEAISSTSPISEREQLSIFESGGSAGQRQHEAETVSPTSTPNQSRRQNSYDSSVVTSARSSMRGVLPDSGKVRDHDIPPGPNSIITLETYAVYDGVPLWLRNDPPRKEEIPAFLCISKHKLHEPWPLTRMTKDGPNNTLVLLVGSKALPDTLIMYGWRPRVQRDQFERCGAEDHNLVQVKGDRASSKIGCWRTATLLELLLAVSVSTPPE